MVDLSEFYEKQKSWKEKLGQNHDLDRENSSQVIDLSEFYELDSSEDGSKPKKLNKRQIRIDCSDRILVINMHEELR
jgi:hypothetical protein